MIKQILGNDNGLSFEKSEENIFLTPSKTKTVTIYGKNTTEYDMQLYISLSLPFGIKSSLKEFDFSVPAEGNSRFELDFSLSDDNKIFMGEAVCEIKVCDRVLEWESVYEIPLMCEMAYCYNEKALFSPDSAPMYTSKGGLWLDGINAALFEIPLQEAKNVIVSSDEGENFCVNLDGNNIHSSKGILFLTLKNRLNKLFIRSDKEQAISFLDTSSEETVCLNTVNPKYFI